MFLHRFRFIGRILGLDGKIDIPVIVRLQGTNAEEAKVLIDNSGLEVHSAITLEEAAGKVTELLV